MIANTIFHTVSSDSTVTFGDNITLTCSFSSYDEHSVISWYRSGELLTNTNRISINNNTPTESESDDRLLFVNFLTVTQLQVSDTGDYMCQVTNEYGTHIQPIGQFTVLGIVPYIVCY